MQILRDLWCKWFGHRWLSYGLWEDKCLRCGEQRGVNEEWPGHYRKDD